MTMGVELRLCPFLKENYYEKSSSITGPINGFLWWS